MKKLVAVVLASLFSTEQGFAHTAATAEEILCRNETALVGTVVDARSHDCRRAQSSCASFYVGASVRVAEVLPPSNGTLRVGDVVSVAFHVRNGLPLKVSPDLTIQMNNSGGGGIGFPATGRAIADVEARAQLLGKRLILAVTPVERFQTDFGAAAHAEFVAELGEPYYAAAYTPSDEAWVRRTWAAPNCAIWKRH